MSHFFIWLRRKAALAALILTCTLLFTAVEVSAAGNKGKSWKAREGEWYVQLIVTTEDGRKDNGNIFGRLADSEDGPDSHDLPELSPPGSPIGDNYLSIVFSRPEWNTKMTDYASDFRSVPKKKRDMNDTWNFEIRTHTPGIPATLSWEGVEEVLGSSSIVDATTGEVLVEDCSVVDSYTVELTEKGVTLVWKYSARKKRGKKNDYHPSSAL